MARSVLRTNRFMPNEWSLGLVWSRPGKHCVRQGRVASCVRSGRYGASRINRNGTASIVFHRAKWPQSFRIRVRGLDDYYGQPGPQHHGHRKTNANTTPRGFGADALRRSWLPSRPRYQVMDPRTDYGIRLVIRLSSAVEP
jgi:hypothetical protein